MKAKEYGGGNGAADEQSDNALQGPWPGSHNVEVAPCEDELLRLKKVDKKVELNEGVDGDKGVSNAGESPKGPRDKRSPCLFAFPPLNQKAKAKGNRREKAKGVQPCSKCIYLFSRHEALFVEKCSATGAWSRRLFIHQTAKRSENVEMPLLKIEYLLEPPVRGR